MSDDLMDNLDPLTIVGFFVLFLGSALAAGGGLGGGGIFVPVLILLVQLEPHDAVPLSQAMIFGGSLVNLFINYRGRHAIVRHRPLIDYDCVLVLEPLMLAGTLIGVMLNRIMPAWFIVIMLVICIGYGAFRTTRKGIRLLRKPKLGGTTDHAKVSASEISPDMGDTHGEGAPSKSGPAKAGTTVVAKLELSAMPVTRSSPAGSSKTSGGDGGARSAGSPHRRIPTDSPEGPRSKKQPSDAVRCRVPTGDDDGSLRDIEMDEPCERRPRAPSVELGTTPEQEAVLRQLLADEAIQWKPLLCVFAIFAVTIIMSLLRGGKAGTSSVVGIENCTAGYYSLFGATLLLMAALAVGFGCHLAKKHKKRLSCGYNFVEGDIHWSVNNVSRYPIFSMIAGVLGGLLGIGGGMIMGPLLLELGMLPTNTQATSATTVLITSGAAMFQFLFLGALLLDYAAVVFILGMFATFLGQTVLNYLVKKYNSTSFIVFSIAIVMILAVILMSIAGTIKTIGDFEDGNYGLSAFCQD